MITPSAARGVLEAIFFRPEMSYEIRRIGVLALGKETVLVRNELEARQGNTPILIEEKRQQRSSLILKDVSYIIEAAIKLRPHATDHVAKYLSQAERRIERGQCFHTPYLGNREFAADFEPVSGELPNPNLDRSLGTMLFDIAFIPSSKRNDFSFKLAGSQETTTGYAHALFFDAKLERGWLNVPAERYRDRYTLEAGDVSRAG
jgi:CRISPR-associated protein Cas5d